MSGVRGIVLIWVVAGGCSSGSDRPKVDERPAPPVATTKPATTKPPADDLYDSGALGALTFELSEGTPEARAHFARGLLALHSFWYDEAIKHFAAAIDADPTMNMAYWGAAMSRCKLLWGDDDITAARQMLTRMPAPNSLPPRAQAWVTATVALLGDGDVRSSRTRFAAAMETLHAKFPDDESATFLALALLSSTRPEAPDNLAVRKRAAALAIDVFQHNPKHPGAAHYLIHAYDTPELAPLALSYAREYAKIAPAAFHARHMPAHIFSRLGMWKEAITSCQSAWDASVGAARREKLSADHHDFHSLNWLVEMNFELGRHKDAAAALEIFAKAVRDGLGHQQRSLYVTQVSSYMARTGEWSRVDQLLAPLEAPAVADPATAMGDVRSGGPNHCAPGTTSNEGLVEQTYAFSARARAAAMQRDLAGTKRLLAEMEVVRAKLRPFLVGTQPKEVIAKIDETYVRHHQALHARAIGDDRALLKILRESAVGADRELGGESNPSGFVPHEEIADTLMRLDQPKAAMVEYTLVLEKHPGRAHSLLGLARALARTGDVRGARARYEQLLQLWSAADEGIDGLAEARTAVAAK